MVTRKAVKSRRIYSSRKRPERLRLSCQYSVSSDYQIWLSLTFSNRNRRDPARERYLAALTRQGRFLPARWVGDLPAHAS